MRTAGVAAILFAAWSGAAAGAAVRIYKQVDNNGHVTYGNVLPREAAFTTMEIETDTVETQSPAPAREILRPEKRLAAPTRIAKASPPLRKGRVAPPTARVAPALALRLDFRLGAPLPISMR